LFDRDPIHPDQHEESDMTWNKSDAAALSGNTAVNTAVRTETIKLSID